MQAPAALRRYLSETHFSVPEAEKLLSIHCAWLGQSLHAAAAIKLIHGPLSNAFKGFVSEGFALFSFQSFRVFEETQLAIQMCVHMSWAVANLGCCAWGGVQRRGGIQAFLV